MDDTMGLTYDCDSAIAYAVKHGDVSEDDARRVLDVRDLLQAIFGIAPAEDAAAVAAARERNADIIRPESIDRRFMSYELEATFAHRETGLPMATVVAVLLADVKYMAARGIVDAEAIDEYEMWMRDWLK